MSEKLCHVELGAKQETKIVACALNHPWRVGVVHTHVRIEADDQRCARNLQDSFDGNAPQPFPRTRLRPVVYQTLQIAESAKGEVQIAKSFWGLISRTGHGIVPEPSAEGVKLIEIRRIQRSNSSGGCASTSPVRWLCLAERSCRCIKT